MTEKWKLIDNDFALYIEDTTQTEDKHEGNINDIYELCNKLNEYEQFKEQVFHLIDKKISDETIKAEIIESQAEGNWNIAINRLIIAELVDLKEKLKQ